jgi:hypothetical protein
MFIVQATGYVLQHLFSQKITKLLITHQSLKQEKYISADLEPLKLFLFDICFSYFENNQIFLCTNYPISIHSVNIPIYVLFL